MKRSLVALSTALAFMQTVKADSECLAFKVEGQNSYGQFHGEFQIQGFQAFRVVQYKDHWKDQYKIEELWTGEKVSNNSGDYLKFNLRHHNFLTTLGSHTLVKEQFQNKESIEIPLNELEKNGSVPCTQILDVANKRTKNILREELDNPFLVKLAKELFIDKIIKWYRDQPFLDSFRNHPDFKDPKVYIYDDFTDLEFYKKNPNTLRLRNSVISDFTLTEASIKRSAFGQSIEDKVAIFENETNRYNINSLGLYQLNFDGEEVPHHDSTLWTGMYLTSQASRYLATKNTDAFNNFTNSLKGLLLLVNICDDTESFARSAMVGSDVPHAQWKRGTGKFSELSWLPGGNNDMIKGLVLGFAWAYKILPENDPLRGEILNALIRLDDVKLRSKSSNNHVYIKGLRFLYTKDHSSYEEFIDAYKKHQGIADLLDIDRPFLLKGITDSSGINLNMVSTLSLLLIAEEIQKDQVDAESRWASYITKKSRNKLHQIYQVMKHAKKDFLCVLSYSVNKDKLGTVPEECWKSFLETPTTYPDEELVSDKRLFEDFTYSAIPNLPWKSFKNMDNPLKHLIGINVFPKYEGEAFSSVMMWKEHSRDYYVSKPRLAKVPRVEFLFSYWTYRYFSER